MSKRGFVNAWEVQRSLLDDDPSYEGLAAYKIEEISRSIETGDPRWQEAVLDVVATIDQANSLDYVVEPTVPREWDSGDGGQGIEKRLKAALGSWRMDASGGKPVQIDQDGQVLWSAGWSLDAAFDTRIDTREWRRYIVLCSIDSEKDGVAVDPESVAVFVAGRTTGRNEWTLFTGGARLADEVSQRIAGGLVVDKVGELGAREKNKTVVREIGSAGLLEARIDRGWDNYRFHTLANINTDNVAKVTDDMSFGSSRLIRPDAGVYENIAHPIFHDTVDAHKTT